MSDFDEIFLSNLLKKDAATITYMDCMDVQSTDENLEFTFCNVCGHFGRHYSRLQVLFCMPCHAASYCQSSGSLLRAEFRNFSKFSPLGLLTGTALQVLKMRKLLKSGPVRLE